MVFIFLDPQLSPLS